MGNRPDETLPPSGQTSIDSICDEFEAAVLNVDTVDRKIALSVKQLTSHKEKAEVQEFLGAQKQATSNIGALLQGAMDRKDGESGE